MIMAGSVSLFTDSGSSMQSYFLMVIEMTTPALGPCVSAVGIDPLWHLIILLFLFSGNIQMILLFSVTIAYPTKQ